MLFLDDIAAFIDDVLDVQRYEFGDDVRSIYRMSEKSVRRMGLALEGSPGVAAWAQEKKLDALFLHRPWKLDLDALPPDVGVLAYHLAFDERLTLGYNPWLAQMLALHHLEVIGRKAGRPLGMIGQVEGAPCEAWVRRLMGVFGGLDEVHVPAATEVTTVAFVGAMSEQLVQEAYGAGAQMYVTGQMRASAREAVTRTGMGVVIAGHRRSEAWGLRTLGGLLPMRFAGLEIEVWGAP
ncbi:MAG: Nif3-like dinuclear metal center hexameric protein [Rhodothermales bacterium]